MDIAGLKALIAQQNLDLNAAVDSLELPAPSPDPLQVQLDAANAKIAELQAKIALGLADAQKVEADLNG